MAPRPKIGPAAVARLVASATATATATATVCAVAAASASAAVVYDNIPNPLPGNLPSEAFQAQGAAEFGGLVQLASGPRANPTVTVTLSSQACETGGGATCQTTPGAKFSEPITLNIYDLGPGNSVGSLVGSQTQTFEIPFRPSADPTGCPVGGTVNGKSTDGTQWFDGTNCNSGLAVNISFDLTSQTLALPEQAIVSVAYNTSGFGYQPYGSQTGCALSGNECGYDSLNVAVTSPPSVGSDPLPNDAYLNTAKPADYCDGGTAGVGSSALTRPRARAGPAFSRRSRSTPPIRRPDRKALPGRPARRAPPALLARRAPPARAARPGRRVRLAKQARPASADAADSGVGAVPPARCAA